MTLFDLVCDQVRTPEHWTAKLDLDTPLPEVDRCFADLLKDYPFPTRINMALADFSPTGLQLRPATDAEANLLTQVRNELSILTGVRHPNHDRYIFHITVAYVLQELTQEEKDEFAAFRLKLLEEWSKPLRTFTLGRPLYVLFEDMGEFAPDLVREV